MITVAPALYLLWRKHSDNHNVHKILLMENGSVVIINGKSISFSGGKLVFVRAGQKLILERNCTAKMLYFKDELYENDLDFKFIMEGSTVFDNLGSHSDTMIAEPSSQEAISIFHQISQVNANLDPNRDAIIRTLIKYLLISSSITLKHRAQESNFNYSAGSNFLRIFQHLVEHNFTREHNVAFYADRLQVSPRALNKRLSKCNSNGPSEIIKSRILLEARKLLLQTTMTIKEIGQLLGYEDPSYFIRFFSKEIGIAPRSYRNLLQADMSAVA